MSIMHRIKTTAPNDQRSKPIAKKPSEPSAKASRKGAGGRPKSDNPKVAFTLRMERSELERWQADPDWRARMVEALRAAKVE
ncbi:hypothetical protein [Nitratireductor sp. GCM10026969]|uniref:hypothetical protein n=1 Tax=Nitratireductor sp. GCM10026969 TaxID=3252645 RepID=UPI003608E28E